jgi:uncharacterized membrane protein
MVQKRKVDDTENNDVPQLVTENIRQLVERQQSRLNQRHSLLKLADFVTRSTGSPYVIGFHVAWFGLWILVNDGFFPGVRPFDPFPWGLLNLLISLEVIFLTLMVLTVQNQIQKDADRRSEVDLHVNLLAENETTMILRKLVRIEQFLQIPVDDQERRMVNDLIKQTSAVELEQKIETTL